MRSPSSGKQRDLPVVLRTHGLDIDRAREYLRGVEGLSREAHTTSDARVLGVALRVLAMHPANVRDLFTKV
jgi:hypothetical protein